MCAAEGGVELLVMLCHVLFIKCNVKHKVKTDLSYVLGIRSQAEPVLGSFMSVFMNGHIQYMYFRCHYCLNKCHKHSNIWVTPVGLCVKQCVYSV